MAEAYLRTGDNEKAIEYYSKAMEIDPDLESAKQALEKLGTTE